VEDERAVYIVEELCTGGELLTHIIEQGAYSEREAAAVFRQVLQVIAYLHSHQARPRPHPTLTPSEV